MLQNRQEPVYTVDKTLQALLVTVNKYYKIIRLHHTVYRLHSHRLHIVYRPPLFTVYIYRLPFTLTSPFTLPRLHLTSPFTPRLPFTPPRLHPVYTRSPPRLHPVYTLSTRCQQGGG